MVRGQGPETESNLDLRGVCAHVTDRWRCQNWRFRCGSSSAPTAEVLFHKLLDVFPGDSASYGQDAACRAVPRLPVTSYGVRGKGGQSGFGAQGAAAVSTVKRCRSQGLAQ